MNAEDRLDRSADVLADEVEQLAARVKQLSAARSKPASAPKPATMLREEHTHAFASASYAPRPSRP